MVPVSGSEVCWAYEEAFGIKSGTGIVQPLGVSRTDIFFDEKFRRQAVEKLNEAVPELNGRKVILYAPTFRGAIKDARTPKMPDIDMLFNRFQKDYVLLIKHHPFIRDNDVIDKKYASFCRQIRQELTTEELIAAADICITDYSSIIFDFSLLKKPILFFAYDLEEYYDERGFYYPYETFVPGPILKSSYEIAECISRIEEFDYNRLDAFRKRFMSGCDGHSTERILAAVFGQAL